MKTERSYTTKKKWDALMTFFIYVAKNISNNTAAETNHPSIDKINKNKINTPDLKFI